MFQADESQYLEPAGGERLLGRRALAQTPPAFATESQQPCPFGGHALTDQQLGDGMASLTLFETHASQLVTQPVVQFPQVGLARRMAEVRHPSAYELIHLADHFPEAHAPVAPGDRAKDAPVRV